MVFARGLIEPVPPVPVEPPALLAADDFLTRPDPPVALLVLSRREPLCRALGMAVM